MIVINRLCRSNANKCLINHISTTVTSRCEKPKDEGNTGKKDGGMDEGGKSEQKADLRKKIFDLFEDNVPLEKRSEAVEKLKTLKMTDAPVSETVTVTQKKKKKKKMDSRPVDEAAGKAKSRLEYNLVQSAKKVADEFGGDVNKTDSELVNALKKFLDNAETEPKRSLKEEKLEKESETSQSHVKDDDVEVDLGKSKESERLKGILGNFDKVAVTKKKQRKSSTDSISISVLLKESDALNIFHPDLERNEGIKLKLWDELEKDELKYLVTSAPRNYYGELIKWTEEGKLWHFPINNEQGMDEEASVDFSEHVFLEDHLEPWCPRTGPLRHFMELVCVGLSKNPYLTVKDKHEHIYWFRDYFEEKKRVLQELGALASRKEIEQPKETEEKQKTN